MPYLGSFHYRGFSWYRRRRAWFFSYWNSDLTFRVTLLGFSYEYFKRLWK